jgi:hypothetical protein
MHGEHETKRYAPGPEPIFSAVTQNRPHRAPPAARATLLVFDLGYTATARAT